MIPNPINTVHFTPSYFQNPTHPITICVIGCGGTGSLLLTRLARLDYALKQLNHPGISVECYDDDIVEPHNVGRQNFTINDVGLNKAIQLISKINMAYGLDWMAHQTRVRDDIPNANIIATCVDSTEVRMAISKTKFSADSYYDTQNSFYWLDCGNGKDFGQVILGTLNSIEQPIINDVLTTDKLKTVVDTYGNLANYDTEEVQGIQSCSYAESILKQDLFINDEIALGASKILWKLLKSPFIDVNGYIINQQQGKSQPYLIAS